MNFHFLLNDNRDWDIPKHAPEKFYVMMGFPFDGDFYCLSRNRSLLVKTTRVCNDTCKMIQGYREGKVEKAIAM